MNGTKKLDLEPPYATHSLVRKHPNICYKRPINSQLCSPQSIYVEPNSSYTSNVWKETPHQILKDSGYYSCEFLDQNSKPFLNGKSSKASKHRICAIKKQNLHPCVPESDSGVFTLSHAYLSPKLPPGAYNNEGIYDNII